MNEQAFDAAALDTSNYDYEAFSLRARRIVEALYAAPEDTCYLDAALGAANTVRSYTSNQEIISAALLHNVLLLADPRQADERNIRGHFNDRVANIACCVAHALRQGKIPEADRQQNGCPNGAYVVLAALRIRQLESVIRQSADTETEPDISCLPEANIFLRALRKRLPTHPITAKLSEFIKQLS